MKINLSTNTVCNRLRYTCQFINKHPLNNGYFEFCINSPEGAEKTVKYGDSFISECDFKIAKQNIWFNKQYPSELVANEYKYNNQKFYSVETVKKIDSAFFQNNKIQFDCLEMIFFHISRVEESKFESTLLNERGQREESSLFLIHQKLNWVPVVDQIVVGLIEVFCSKILNVKTNIAFTHDIDFIKKYKHVFSMIKSGCKAILQRKNPLDTYRQYRNELIGSDASAYNTFDSLLLKNEAVEKNIYFLMGGKHKYDNQYDLDHPIFINAIRIARERDYKIGIHPSYNSWKSLELMKKEKHRLEEAIGENIKISRQHYLHFDINSTPNLLIQLGIEKDASLGYTRNIGFKCGTGFKYKLYNFATESESKLFEDPLVYMDSAALYGTNMMKESAMFFGTNKSNTRICVNFHNSRFDPTTKEGKEVAITYDFIQSGII